MHRISTECVAKMIGPVLSKPIERQANSFSFGTDKKRLQIAPGQSRSTIILPESIMAISVQSMWDTKSMRSMIPDYLNCRENKDSSAFEKKRIGGVTWWWIESPWGTRSTPTPLSISVIPGLTAGSLSDSTGPGEIGVK